jgi:hypothetical protein
MILMGICECQVLFFCLFFVIVVSVRFSVDELEKGRFCLYHVFVLRKRSLDCFSAFRSTSISYFYFTHFLSHLLELL